jgi:hypothetical protein
MAIRAADLALCEFIFNRRPRIPSSSQETHSLSLCGAIDMIKFKNDRVRLAAIDAWMYEQVLP